MKARLPYTRGPGADGIDAAVVELRGVESAEEQAEKRRLLELLGG